MVLARNLVLNTKWWREPMLLPLSKCSGLRLRFEHVLASRL